MNERLTLRRQYLEPRFQGRALPLALFQQLERRGGRCSDKCVKLERVLQGERRCVETLESRPRQQRLEIAAVTEDTRAHGRRPERQFTADLRLEGATALNHERDGDIVQGLRQQG